MSMTRLKRFAAWASAALVVPVGLSAQLAENVRRDALKVVRALEAIEAGHAAPSPAGAGRMDFTEDEFNAYIAYRIESEKSDIMTDLRLKLFDQNRVEGKVVIDLRGQNLPSFLKPVMTLYFEGVVITDQGRAKLDFKKLFIEGQAIPVAVLDIVMSLAAKLSKSEPTSIHDWYLLPHGIRELRTQAGRLSVIY
jgi:hypothetical protein